MRGLHRNEKRIAKPRDTSKQIKRGHPLARILARQVTGFFTRRHREMSGLGVYGVILRLSSRTAPIVAALSANDRERARRFATLKRNGLVLHGFSSIMFYFDEFSQTTHAPPFGRLLEILAADTFRGFEAILVDDSKVLSDACRSIMEVTVLLTEWGFDPARMTQWWESDEARRAQMFSFGNVLNRVHKHLGIDDQHVLDMKAHYRVHSMWLHPTREDSATVTPSLDLALDELIGHVDKAARTVDELVARQTQQVGLPPGRRLNTFPNVWLHLLEARRARENARAEQMASEGFEILAPTVLPKNWTKSDIVRPLNQQDR